MFEILPSQIPMLSQNSYPLIYAILCLTACQVFLLADFLNIYCKEQNKQHCTSIICQPSSAFSLLLEISDPALIKMEELDYGIDLELTSSKHMNLPEGGSLVHHFSKNTGKQTFSRNSSSLCYSLVLSVVSPSELSSCLNSQLRSAFL